MSAVEATQFFMVAKYQHFPATTRRREWIVLGQDGSLGFFRITQRPGCGMYFLVSWNGVPTLFLQRRLSIVMVSRMQFSHPGWGNAYLSGRGAGAPLTMTTCTWKTSRARDHWKLAGMICTSPTSACAGHPRTRVEFFVADYPDQCDGLCVCVGRSTERAITPLSFVPEEFF